MSKIYGLVDPRCGNIRYVGRTKQRLSMRLSQHIGIARRRKFVNPRTSWILEIIESGLKPLITDLETVPDANEVEAEARWISRFDGLVNSGSPAQGGCKSYVAKWTPELEAILGKKPDSVIAEMLGVTRKAVTYRRKVLGIHAGCSRERNKPPPRMAGHNKIEIPQWVIDLMGSMPDYLLAEKSGINKKTLNRERRRRFIASYADRTGNTGKFNPGSYPMRWLKQNGPQTRA